jgi:hypothetical protein
MFTVAAVGPRLSTIRREVAVGIELDAPRERGQHAAGRGIVVDADADVEVLVVGCAQRGGMDGVADEVELVEEVRVVAELVRHRVREALEWHVGDVGRERRGAHEARRDDEGREDEALHRCLSAMMNSTRRFFARPAGERFGAIGRDSP